MHLFEDLYLRRSDRKAIRAPEEAAAAAMASFFRVGAIINIFSRQILQTNKKSPDKTSRE